MNQIMVWILLRGGVFRLLQGVNYYVCDVYLMHSEWYRRYEGGSELVEDTEDTI